MTVALLTMGWQSLAPIWAPPGVADEADSHVAFRGRFTSHSPQARLKIAGASEYLVWLDGKLIHNGPARFAVGHPEYQTVPLAASAGPHLLAVHVRNEGVGTRIASQGKPFLWCQIAEGEDTDPINWRCVRLPGYRPRAARISDILGWIDWCDTRQLRADWQAETFDDSGWASPVSVEAPGELSPAKTSPLRLPILPLKPLARGEFCVTYGYEADDPGVRFFLDDLNPKGVPGQGIWRRYDLGRVRLGRPKITLDVPAGTVVEMAFCEELRHDRVHPWLNLSGSRSCNMDHFVARGGVQEFMPFTPKGGRFLEVHVRSTSAKFVREEFLERTYYGEPVGTFTCDDPLLNKIWKVGVDTVRACSEDALVDCPTRERGQWTGDVASVATEIVACAFGDLSLSRRALVQAAQAAREDGLVAGVGPADPGYLSTYAAQWVTACVRYWELTGDRSLLEELLPAARRNIGAFEAARSSGTAVREGVPDSLGWAFVDWGYVRNEGPSDIALDLHYLMALRSMIRWEKALGNKPSAYETAAVEMEAGLRGWLSKRISEPTGWKAVGYQRGALALLADLVPASEIKNCIAMIEGHLRSCFPNDPKAPRLSDPGVAEERVMTPYFCHFAFAALLRHGEIDFVLSQYRKCWGWALGDGRTTWLEVFDTRWSHCHEWSGCPTWQLSSFVLGLRPRFDLGDLTFDFAPMPGKLKRAEGDVPLPGGGAVHVKWERQGVGLRVTFESPKQATIRIAGESYQVNGTKTLTLAKLG